MNINLLGKYNLKLTKLNFTFKLPRMSKRARFQNYIVKFLGEDLYVHDSASFNLGIVEIFRNECYKFNSVKTNPVIVDCGANIGMSAIYFKKLFPFSKIYAFEADPKIFEFLEKNVKSFKLNNITLYNNAVWKEDSILEFYSEYGAGGRLDSSIVETGLVQEKYKVQGFKLSKLLKEQKDIDFLKIDIEGAELEVLKEIEQELNRVEKIFIEYHSFIGQKQRLDQILKILSDNNFKYFIKNAIEHKHPFIKNVNIAGMDLQLEIYAYK